MKKAISIMLVMIMILNVGIMVYANDEVKQGFDEIKTEVVIEQDSGESVILKNRVEFDEVKTERVTEDGEKYDEIMPTSVSLSEDFNLSIGQSWSRSYYMDNLFAEAHNAFKINTIDVKGRYRIIINGSNGYSTSSEEYTNVGTKITITNAKPGVKYMVYIVNTGEGTLTGQVQISSYYN